MKKGKVRKAPKKIKLPLSFKERVYLVVRTIPRGAVLTYKEVAKRVGSPHAFRAVGSALRQNFNPNIPCHRVIKSDGSIGEYNRGSVLKHTLLREEGVIITR